jgi:HAD superfamily hydrolase (TIGR01457 family)
MIKGYIFDMDGVIWDGDKAIPHAAERINEIIASGKKYAFMSNNALRSRDTYVKRLGKFGINTNKEHVIISSYAAGLYITKRKGVSKVYAMGTKDLKKELEDAGHRLVDEGADFVVVGLDLTVDYNKLDTAFRNLMGGADLLACAPDLTYLEDGRIRLGSGAFAKALEVASGKRMNVIGKPNTIMVELAREKMGLKSDEIMKVGDKLVTDIAVGKKVGMKTALVLTGETKREDLEGSRIEPDFVLESLRDLP